MEDCDSTSSAVLSPFEALFGGMGVSSRALVRVDAKNVGGMVDLCCCFPVPPLTCSSDSLAMPPRGSISLYSASVMSTARRIPFDALVPLGI